MKYVADEGPPQPEIEIVIDEQMIIILSIAIAVVLVCAIGICCWQKAKHRQEKGDMVQARLMFLNEGPKVQTSIS